MTRTSTCIQAIRLLRAYRVNGQIQLPELVSSSPATAGARSSCAAMAAQAAAGARGWGLDPAAMAAAMAAPSLPPQGGLGGQRHSHIVTRRSPDTVLHRREMARQMSGNGPEN